MGVTGLWTVVHPCARPVKIETLNKKRLAVDASIWIYQFLKAVRDKEGNALRNSHVVGFFRRICKLLFIGIKPVFVFDGGAPALKRQTINNRKRRREGRRDDAVRTAGKLLALQMQRLAEEEEERRKEEAGQARHTVDAEEEPLPENLVYVDEIQMTPQERQQNRKFRKKDAYHLPELDASLAEMGQPNDPRIMSLEELEQYAKQFHTGEDINVYDFSKIDFDSPFFVSLPASDRYNILNAARLRSRLRMGYSKEQLDTMFPDRMAFSRFQIERVKERNELTQRLMHINGMNDDLLGINGVSRVAGEKGREYVLVKNDGVEGGWALGVVSNKDEGQRSKPIDVEQLDRRVDVEGEDSEDEEFEDVPIEGLNRLPTRPRPAGTAVDGLFTRDLERRKALYKSRKTDVPRKPKAPITDNPDSLFVAPFSDGEEWEDIGVDLPTGSVRNNTDAVSSEDEELQRAIAMSMQQDMTSSKDEDDEYQEVFGQSRVEEARPFIKASGLAIAHMANTRSSKVAVKPFVTEDSDEDDIDLQAALAESRQTKYTPKSPSRQENVLHPRPVPKEHTPRKSAGFDGPLPFEKLDLGSSLLGKRKLQKLTEDAAGGFERESEKPKEKQSEPLPPWFSRDPEEGLSAQKAAEERERQREREAADDEFVFEDQPRLRKQDERVVIDLEAPEHPSRSDAENESSDGADIDMRDASPAQHSPHAKDISENLQEVPPSPQKSSLVEPTEMVASDDEPLEWEESDRETTSIPAVPPPSNPADKSMQADPNASLADDSEDEEFEDVVVHVQQPFDSAVPETANVPEARVENGTTLLSAGLADQDAMYADEELEEDLYSDPEDEELFRQLALEDEEHARFASTLNNRSVAQNIQDYEQELKQLRNQQKKDRRDADEVTQTMITECQQLLALFGLPYITAPMEAEAQCAELVRLGLVDGIVTDDSDIFLFGGTRVYKNMFNQAKFVECYLTSDLESEFGLSRQRLISIAQLLGSDYTDGLPGVGPVTALEMLSEFDDLPSFKDWWVAVQNGMRSKQDDASSAFRKKFRKNITKLFLPPTFPDPRVDQAYFEPEVDSDPSTFVWGVPDLSALRAFLMSTIGWSPERTDEVLVPVIKDMNRRETEGTQANITSFFSGNVGAGAFAPRRRGEGTSKRLESALHRIGDRARRDTDGVEHGASAQDEQDEDPTPIPQRSARKGTKSTKRSRKTTSTERSEDYEEEEVVEPRREKARNTRNKRKKVGGSANGNAV